jgi:hypothetical protein
MEWWVVNEIEKYKDKQVKYNNSVWTVKEVFWREKDEEFIYWIENSKGVLNKVFEKNIELINANLNGG